MSFFEGCQWRVLADTDARDAEKLDRLMERVRQDATKRTGIMKHDIFVISEMIEQQQYDFHIVRPSPRELFLATDFAYLKDVLARRRLLEQGENDEMTPWRALRDGSTSTPARCSAPSVPKSLALKFWRKIAR